MIRINLVPPEISEGKKSKKRLGYLLIISIGLIAIMFFAYLTVSWYAFQASSSLAKIEESNKDLQNIIMKFKSYESIQNEVAKREGMINEISKDQVLWSHVLNELSMLTPTDIWFSYMETNSKEGITVKGYTFQHSSVANLMTKLNEIKQVDIIGLQYSQKTTLEDQKIVEFNVSAKFPTVNLTQKATPAKVAPEKGTGQ
jgi:Tfp pilus assembly protein PilN